VAQVTKPCGTHPCPGKTNRQYFKYCKMTCCNVLHVVVVVVTLFVMFVLDYIFDSSHLIELCFS
jgi:hypothetical protein